jgi:SAM-dependent methyltransferase
MDRLRACFYQTEDRIVNGTTPTQHEGGRFAGRVEDYRRFRPRYPAAILDLLEIDCGLTSDAPVADIAAGTGLFTELLLQHGNPVTAVEPNEEMRQVCSTLQSQYPLLRVLNGTAENTGLPSHSVDFLTAAQAFHWFEPAACRQEFVRVLRPQGWCVIVFNQRRAGGDPFHDGYEALTQRHNIDYGSVTERYPDEAFLRRFFAPHPMRLYTLQNNQQLTYEALLGRTVSSSFMPKSNHPGFTAMQADLRKLFSSNESNGLIQLDYACIVSYGRLV